MWKTRKISFVPRRNIYILLLYRYTGTCNYISRRVFIVYNKIAMLLYLLVVVIIFEPSFNAPHTIIKVSFLHLVFDSPGLPEHKFGLLLRWNAIGRSISRAFLVLQSIGKQPAAVNQLLLN